MMSCLHLFGHERGREGGRRSRLEASRAEAWTEVGWSNTRVRARWATRWIETGARTGGSG